MIIHEHQAKQIAASYGVRVPRGQVASSREEAQEAASQLACSPVVVKAQVHAGGRGKAGGVKVVEGALDARRAAEMMLGKPLSTRQTGSAAKLVRSVLIEEGFKFQQELYAGFVLDREVCRVALMLSSEGGVDIEEVARERPQSIIHEAINPLTGLMPHQVRKIGEQLGLNAQVTKQAAQLLMGAYKAFVELDASLIEFNPLVVTDQGELVALDAKMSFDENALFRHPQILKLRDPEEEEAAELEASKYGLSYIRLEGKIGCMVNGAGLAMATMDIIKLCGGEPANFLDVGGGTDAKRVATAFKILLSDKNVKAVLVNIFGGIVRCDVIAEGVLEAIRQIGIQVPLVVRLQGTMVESGRALLNQADLEVISVNTMEEAAKAVVGAAERRS